MNVAALATGLRALAADLPASGLAAADAHLEGALAELTEASKDSRTELGRHRLTAAREHLAAARTRLAETATAVDDYLEAIGAHGTTTAVSATATPGPVTETHDPLDSRRWWTDRVDELCRRTGSSASAPTTPTRLFNELLRDAADGSADAYHRRLREAGAETGVRLPGLAWPLVRALAAEHLGRTPAARDVLALQNRCTDRVRALIPGIEPERIADALAAACTLGPTARRGETGDAAETAAVGPALIAALHRLPKTPRADRPRPERKGRR